VKAEEALQAANTDDAGSSDSRSDNSSSVISSDTPDVCCCECFCSICSILFCSVHPRVLLDALGHTLMPFCPVSRQFFGFFPGDVHVFKVVFHDVRPAYPRSSWLLLYPFNSHCVAW